MIEASSRCLARILCTELKGVGPKVAANLKKLNIISVQDLLFHLPLRYEDRTVSKNLNQIMLGDQVQVAGEIIHSEVKQTSRRSFICRIQDPTGYLSLRFFYFNANQIDLFKIGRKIQCYGEIRRGFAGYEMVHPEYRFIEDNVVVEIENTLTPVYPTTEGLNQFTFRKLTDQALKLLNEENHLEEFLPESILQQYSLLSLTNAINYVHRPPNNANVILLNQCLHHSQQRLVFEELLAHQLSLTMLRSRVKKSQAPVVTGEAKLINIFKQKLGFSLTNAQERVTAEILQDLQGATPMLRLIQGDVGSGKTVVAAITALHLIASGYQVAVMAPTELLAEQHYKNFLMWFEPLGVTVGWLTSGLRGKQKETTIQSLQLGQTQVVIGTHALFQEKTKFNRLGLVIIDEQHRFGVDQRLSLLNKGNEQNYQPHQLIMSATPIPRTLAMTAYGDLDVSIIDELPPGRTPIKTIVLPQAKREELTERIRVNCQGGAQAYWVCTLIQESEVLQCQAAEEVAKELANYLPELRIGLVHGRMKSKEKESVMHAFKEKELQLLVATTVIEVGVDVPNASLMVIENSERLGLAQLHQLRGRVGRGLASSYCVLLYQSPLSKLAQERLNVLRDSSDGFIIAEKDLQLRGPGELLGKRQTGLMHLKIADLIRDQAQLPKVQNAARDLLYQYPEHASNIVTRWLGDNQKFTEV